MRSLGVALLVVGLALVCYGWREEQVGLHMRSYSVETWWQHQLAVFRFVGFHSTTMKIGAALALGGLIASVIGTKTD